MTVIRRLDAVLEPRKDTVLRMKEQLDEAGIANQDSALRQESAVYNCSAFRLRGLAARGRQQQLRADFQAYLDGFSPNVQEVLENFKFRNQIPTLVEADALGFLLEKLLDRSINLSLRPVLNGDGSVRLQAFLAFEETEIFPNEAFGYWNVTVERPLRLAVVLSPARRRCFRETCRAAKDEPFADVIDGVEAAIGVGPHHDFNRFTRAVAAEAAEQRVKLTAKRKNLIKASLASRDENAEPVVKAIHKPATVKPDPICGLDEATMEDGQRRGVEHEPNSDLRDTEQVPLIEEGGVDAFLRREVLPYAPDAWFEPDKVKIGYEVSFNRPFYKPKPMRPSEDIRADIVALEGETEGLLAEMLFS